MRHLCGLHAISIGEKVGKREREKEKSIDCRRAWKMIMLHEVGLELTTIVSR